MDKNYWAKYYTKEVAPIEPSQFAKDVIGHFEQSKTLLELGCGNGRDCIYFHRNGIDVTAIDQAETAINKLKAEYPKIKFHLDDFINTEVLNNQFNYVYSRFTLHSISLEQQNVVLQRAYSALKDKGLLLIEARSTKDDLYGLGEMVGANEYIYENHYRRFIEKSELEETIEKLGYNIKVIDEGKGFAKYKDQDPVLIRLIAEK